MLDRRFPYLIRLSEIVGLNTADRIAVVRFGEEVNERTGAYVLYDLRDGSLFYFIREITQGLALSPTLSVFRMAARFDMGLMARIDDVCRMILQGRMARSMKDRLAAWAAKRQESAEAAYKAVRHTELEYVTRNERKTWRRSLQTIRGYREFLTGRAGR